MGEGKQFRRPLRGGLYMGIGNPLNSNIQPQSKNGAIK